MFFSQFLVGDLLGDGRALQRKIGLVADFCRFGVGLPKTFSRLQRGFSRLQFQGRVLYHDRIHLRCREGSLGFLQINILDRWATTCQQGAGQHNKDKRAYKLVLSIHEKIPPGHGWAQGLTFRPISLFRV